MQWARVQRRLDDVGAVYTGRLGGTDAAGDTVQSFFEAVHHLKDWLGNDPSSGVTKAAGDSLINASPVLQLCADLANGSKHLVLTSSRAGDTSTTIARNDVTVFAGAAVLGVDFSWEMVRRAAGPPGPPGHPPGVPRTPPAAPACLVGDALRLPLRDSSVDLVTIAFGLRNLPEPGRGLLEFRRVLRPGGRLVVCEFSQPVVPVLRGVYRRYLTRLMPVAARRLTSDPEAYQYLARSIGAWPDQAGLAVWLQQAGFTRVAWRDLTGGIVALHRATAGS